MSSVEVGDHCPDLTGTDQSGLEIRLSDLWKSGVLVLFFYPRDGTPVCTQEVCSFRDAYEDFVTAGATVVGVSSSSIERHEQFVKEHKLPYRLVSDASGALRAAFGVPKFLGFMPGRATYVIDSTGVIRHVIVGHLVSAPHITEALSVVRRLQRENAARETP